MSWSSAVGHGIGTVGLRLAERFNPIVSDPSAPLKTAAIFNAFGPSLMPRASMHQGMAAGLSVLAAEMVGKGIDAGIRRLVPSASPFPVRIIARAAVATAGYAASRIPETDDESTVVASARSAARLAMVGAIGGIAYEAGTELRSRFPASGPIRPILVGLGGFAGAMAYSGKLLGTREGLIQRWSDEDKPASLPIAIGIGFGVASAGRGVARAFISSRRGMADFFGTDALHAQIGRTLNLAVWAAGGVALYNAGVGYIARSNERIEPAYAEPPENPHVSGGPNSISPFEELGLQGRRYVTDVVTPDLIEATLGEPAVAQPIRAYIGYNSEPIYASGRSELALEEMERLGAFDRSYLLLFSPTGTGWVDQTMIESAEILARGDIATCCIQYGRSPSFLALQKVALGRAQFRQLLWGVKQRLAERPPDERPTILVFGESLGAWSSSDVVMHQGIGGFDHYGIDRALWFGLPGLAKWSKTGMREGSSELVPAGTVGAFDRFEQFDALTDEERDRMRAVILDHDNDPIAQISLRLAVKTPPWLRNRERGRGVPESMSWVPLITFVQIMIDAMNAMRVVPGQFKSFGHDYRGDTAQFVHAAYHFPAVDDEQMTKVGETLLQLEVERGERIKRFKEAKEGAHAAKPKRARGPKWLRDRTKADAGTPRVEPTAGEAGTDYQ